MADIRPFLKRSRWWVINEGVLTDALAAVEAGEATAEQVMIEMLEDSELGRLVVGVPVSGQSSWEGTHGRCAPRPDSCARGGADHRRPRGGGRTDGEVLAAGSRGVER